MQLVNLTLIFDSVWNDSHLGTNLRAAWGISMFSIRLRSMWEKWMGFKSTALLSTIQSFYPVEAVSAVAISKIHERQTIHKPSTFSTYSSQKPLHNTHHRISCKKMVSQKEDERVKLSLLPIRFYVCRGNVINLTPPLQQCFLMQWGFHFFLSLTVTPKSKLSHVTGRLSPSSRW